MTPEEIHDMLYAKIQEDADRLINMSPQTKESFVNAVQELVMKEWEESGRPGPAEVEVQYDQENKTIKVIEHWPISGIYVCGVLEEEET